MLQFWQGKSVLLTGHTGFKGSWMSLWLDQLGANVSGYALQPSTTPSLFESCGLGYRMNSVLGDVADLERLKQTIQHSNPEIVFHLAAQPLVRQSYIDPVGTYMTNVMGTIHLLEAVRTCPSVKAVVIITTDKVYDNKEWLWSYREDERLGGKDPYSASKACAELAVNSYRDSYFSDSSFDKHQVAIATARAGNIIGGGDWSQDRLVPDSLKALELDQAITLRNPHAVRPWQHVLAPVHGYLLLAQRLYEEGLDYQGAWNFGPLDQDAQPVLAVVEQLHQLWGSKIPVVVESDQAKPEAQLLKLDSTKARSLLGWNPTWDLNMSLRKIVEWHRSYLAGGDVHKLTLKQIEEYARGVI
ncbi:MAG: CDP-glucose 4,6-dehydratase [Candidatus Cohnella colombiensis]|uniref:CDP-glucose 4,6-dehydratase n=1 Tax=Candidatus Cohnella colombiensis TaxID=3121368 RepID=A0AA95EXN0_9BACL|nr:MAG: CDP-glucose 4,6-dehydratase [Cohnella sp.]